MPYRTGYTFACVTILFMTTALHADMLPSSHRSIMKNATVEEVVIDEKKVDSFPTYRGRSYNKHSLTPTGHKAVAVEALPVENMEDLNVRITAWVTYRPDWHEKYVWKRYGRKNAIPYYSFRVFFNDALVGVVDESRKPTADFMHMVKNRGYYSIRVDASALDSHLRYTIQRFAVDRNSNLTAAERP